VKQPAPRDLGKERGRRHGRGRLARIARRVAGRSRNADDARLTHDALDAAI
jgi:hypothetical protein